MKRFALTSLFFLFGGFQIANSSPLLVGGGQAGNGADAVVCSKGFKLSAELLDIYEARVLYGKKFAYPERGVGGTAITELAYMSAENQLDKLNFLPVKQARLKTYIREFHENALYVSDVQLTDIPDSLQVAIPAGCSLAQLIIQNPNPKFGQKRYTVNEDLWKLLDYPSRTAAILHEVIYRDQIEMGHSDSRWTRYFNALIFSNDIVKMNPAEINKVLREGADQVFFQDGLELLGAPSASQEIYQVVGVAPGAPYPALIDGRYNLKMRQLLDYTTLRGGNVFGINSPMTYGVELKDDVISKAYVFKGSLNKISIKSKRDFYDGVSGGDWSFESVWIPITKNIQGVIEIGSVGQLGVEFDNGVTVFMPPVPLTANMTAQDLLNQTCNNEFCSKKWYSFIFAENSIEYHAQAAFWYRGTAFDRFVSEHQASKFRNKAPNNLPESFAATYKFSPREITFKSDGGFYFTVEFWDPTKEFIDIVLKSGKIFPFKTKKTWTLIFDKEGHVESFHP